MANSDMNDAEARASELAKLSAMFFRKCLAEEMPLFVAQDMARTYLQTVMLADHPKPKDPPWLPGGQPDDPR